MFIHFIIKYTVRGETCSVAHKHFSHAVDESLVLQHLFKILMLCAARSLVAYKLYLPAIFFVFILEDGERGRRGRFSERGGATFKSLKDRHSLVLYQETAAKLKLIKTKVSCTD